MTDTNKTGNDLASLVQREVTGHPGYPEFAAWCEIQLIHPYPIYFMIWQASREAVVVELPQGLCMFDMSGGRAPGGLPLIELKQAADAIEASGLKYEVMP